MQCLTKLGKGGEGGYVTKVWICQFKTETITIQTLKNMYGS